MRGGGEVKTGNIVGRGKRGINGSVKWVIV